MEKNCTHAIVKARLLQMLRRYWLNPMPYVERWVEVLPFKINYCSALRVGQQHTPTHTIALPLAHLHRAVHAESRAFEVRSLSLVDKRVRELETPLQGCTWAARAARRKCTGSTRTKTLPRGHLPVVRAAVINVIQGERRADAKKG